MRFFNRDWVVATDLVSDWLKRASPERSSLRLDLIIFELSLLVLLFLPKNSESPPNF